MWARGLVGRKEWSIVLSLVVVAFWCFLAFIGIQHAGLLHISTNIQGNSNKEQAAKSVEVFRKNMIQTSAKLSPVPLMLMVSLKETSRRATVLGEEMETLSKEISKVSSCVPDIVVCDQAGENTDYEKFDPKSKGCNICSIPGAACTNNKAVAATEYQPNMYNTIMSVSGYYLNRTRWGEPRARTRFVSADNRSTILILQSNLPKCSNVKKFWPLADWVRDMAKVRLSTDEFEFYLSSYAEQIRATAMGTIHDTLLSHVISLPCAWFLLFITVGPSSFLVFATMPIGFLAAVTPLAIIQKAIFYEYSHFSAGLWVSIVIAMSIDYALFMLSRWKEERISGRTNLSAIRVSVCTAGKTVLVSGLILAASFLSVALVGNTIVQEVGVSCAIVNIFVIGVNLTLIPALMILLGFSRCCFEKSQKLQRCRNSVADMIETNMRRFPRLSNCLQWMIRDDDEDHRMIVSELSSGGSAGNNSESTIDRGSAEGINSFDASGIELAMMPIRGAEKTDIGSAETNAVLYNPIGCEKDDGAKEEISDKKESDAVEVEEEEEEEEEAMSLGHDSCDMEKLRERANSSTPLAFDRKTRLSQRNGSTDSDRDVVQQPAISIVPADSLWVQIALLCRRRPIAVIVGLLVLGLPLAVQTFRLKISISFEQLLIADSSPVRAMHVFQQNGFNAGILNKHYIVLNVGPPISLWNSTSNKTDTSHSNGGVPESNITGPTCPPDDPGGILMNQEESKNNVTCASMIDYAVKRLPGVGKSLVCAYNPSMNNPGFVHTDATFSDLCPFSCNSSCVSVAPGYESKRKRKENSAKSKRSFNGQSHDELLASLFECNDDEAGWINRVTPCFILPDSKTFVCSRSGKVNCGVLDYALDQCNGGNHHFLNSWRHLNHYPHTFDHLCSQTCGHCPYKQRILSKNVHEVTKKLVHGLMSLQAAEMGSQSVASLSWMDESVVEFEQSIELLNRTRNGFNESYHDADSFALAYRDQVTRLKSTLGSSAVIELTPKWNTIGRNAAVWVKEVRDLLRQVEAEAHEKAVPLGFFFSGMAPVLADIKATMYETAPTYMAFAIGFTVVVITFISFRSAFIGLRLLLTVVFSLSWVAGLIVVLIQDIKIGGAQGDGMHFVIPIVAIPVLIGLTLDYDLFLLVRIFEYRHQGYSTKDATMIAMHNTSSIITVAGLIMIIAFSSLISSKLMALKTIGLLITMTCFVDTFLVRALLVPAILMVGAEANWWPGRVPEISKRCEVR